MITVDWHGLFVPSHGLVEIVLRGIVTYLSILVILRGLLKRQTGGMGMADLLVIVLIADAAQNAMAGEYRSITEGVVLVITIVGCSLVLDWVAYHVPVIARILHPPPLALIENGQINRRHLRQELITRDELMSELRLQGIEDVTEVKRACVESDGQISIVRRDQGEPAGPRRDPARGA